MERRIKGARHVFISCQFSSQSFIRGNIETRISPHPSFRDRIVQAIQCKRQAQSRGDYLLPSDVVRGQAARVSRIGLPLVELAETALLRQL